MPFNIINEQRNTFNKLETFVQDFSLLLEAILVFSCFFFYLFKSEVNGRFQLQIAFKSTELTHTSKYLRKTAFVFSPF